MPRIHGQRIMLREYQAEDIGPIRSWVNDADTTRFLSTRFWPAQSMTDTQEYLSRVMQSSFNAYHFVIANGTDGRYIGQIDMFQVDWKLRCGTLGMVIASPQDRGKGIGCEALQLMEHFAFQTLGLERLELEVLMENQPALRCYEKAGFALEGVKRHAFYLDGRFCDVGMMSMLHGEY